MHNVMEDMLINTIELMYQYMSKMNDHIRKHVKRSTKALPFPHTVIVILLHLGHPINDTKECEVTKFLMFGAYQIANCPRALTINHKVKTELPTTIGGSSSSPPPPQPLPLAQISIHDLIQCMDAIQTY